MQGFLLGLANGMTCLAFCAPVLVPFLLDEAATIGQNLLTLLKFLAGRLGGYALTGLLAWGTGALLLQSTVHQSLLVGTAYVGLSILLLTSALRGRGSASACALERTQARLRRWPALLPVGMGFMAGLKICPPLLLAFTDAANRGTLLGSLALFGAFFVGTCIYFLPLSLLGALKGLSDLRIVGRMAAVIVAAYYLLSGILLFIGGVR